MFRAILISQWKASRGLALLATLVAFALPLASLQNAQSASNAAGFVVSMQAWGAFYGIAAAGVGLLVALAAWRPDHAGHHVYALSLPVSRARYAGFRFGAGLLFLTPAIIALLLGAIVVAMTGAIPNGLHAYPIALALRFALAAVVAFSLFFAIASSTPKTAGIIVALIAGVFFVQYLFVVFGSNLNILGPVGDFIFIRPGILSVFSGRWMLIDV